MRYSRTVCLKDGRKCIIRNAEESDAEDMLRLFLKTHSETDFLLFYPDECIFSAGEERSYLKSKADSGREIELCAVIDGHIAGCAGIDSIGDKEKIRHRADFGISIEKEFWNLGIGSALLECVLDAARKAGYKQLELEAVGSNAAALALYEKAGFMVYGRNPMGFRSRYSGWQEVVLMRLVL